MTAIEVGDGIAEEPSSDDYDQVFFTQNVETIEAFSSCMVLVRAEKAYTGGFINVMTQALWTGDSSLLQGSLYRIHTQNWDRVVRMQLWW